MDFPPVRFAEGSDDIVEGLAIPFGGPFRGNADLYRTRFDHADLHLDWYPVRPVLYHHGQDPEVRASVIGSAATADITDYDDGKRKGKWVRAQLDKRHEYFEAIKDLVARGALGWSHGTIDYLVDADPPARDGTRNIRSWPVAEFTLTPVEANPDAFAVLHTVRSADAAAVLELLGTTADLIAARGWLPEGTTQGDLDDGDFAWISDDGKTRKLPYKIHGKVNEAGWKAAWSRAHQDATQFDGGPSQDATIAKLKKDVPEGVSTKYDTEPAGENPPGRSAALRGIQTFADIQAGAEMSEELPEAFDTLTSAIYSAIYATDKDFNPETPEAKKAAIQKSLDEFGVFVIGILDKAAAAGRSAPVPFRAAKRNSASDQSHIDGAHVAAHAAVTHTLAAGANCDTCAAPGQEGDDAGGTDGGTTSNDDDGDESTARSADAGPALIRIVDRPVTDDVGEAVRAALAEAEEIGRSTAARVLGRT